MMKRKLLALSLTLVLALALCACGGSGGGTLAGGTWTQQEVELSDLQSYGAEDLKGPIPEDWTLPEDFTVGDNTRVEINGDKILYGEREGEYLDGFTVATYADGALSTIYEFKSGLVTSWQQFFSPDGSKLVVAWIPSADSTDWNVTLVDLATREESKLERPEMFIQTEGQEGEKDAAKAPELVMVKWKDDNNLLVTGSLKNFDDSTKPVSYLYTLPAGE